MRRALLMYSTGIIGLALGIIASTVFAQTTANGPYYATPSWDQTLPASTRFIVLSNMGSNAVLDRETGAVWERSPSFSLFDWQNAHIHCNTLTVGNRKGWRVPTVQELASLIDPSVGPSGPTLPPGHPFINVQLPLFGGYWSATVSSFNTPLLAWSVAFHGSNPIQAESKTNGSVVWCVRGGQGVDTQ